MVVHVRRRRDLRVISCVRSCCRMRIRLTRWRDRGGHWICEHSKLTRSCILDDRRRSRRSRRSEEGYERTRRTMYTYLFFFLFLSEHRPISWKCTNIYIFIRRRMINLWGTHTYRASVDYPYPDIGAYYYISVTCCGDMSSETETTQQKQNNSSVQQFSTLLALVTGGLISFCSTSSLFFL